MNLKFRYHKLCRSYGKVLQQLIGECPWVKLGTFVLQLLLLSQYDKALLTTNLFDFLLNLIKHFKRVF